MSPAFGMRSRRLDQSVKHSFMSGRSGEIEYSMPNGR